MTGRYERIRAALANGPTPGPWDGDDNSVSRLWSNGTAGIREYIALPDAEGSDPNPADMHWIAACDPDTIRALLEERDALKAEVAALREERDALARENEAMKRCAIRYLEWLGVTHMPLDQALRADMHNPMMCGDAALPQGGKQ
ncbi:MAG TPA: cell division protein ZapB [Methylophilaceae bacterium]